MTRLWAWLCRRLCRRRTVDVGSYGVWQLTRDGWRLRPPRTPIDDYRDRGLM